MPSRNPIDAEKFRQELKAGVERLRASINSRVPPREQGHFLTVVDRIQEAITSQAPQIDQLQGHIQRSKDSTRRYLRARPSDMVQMLNELDGLEQGVVEFFTQVISDDKPD